MNCYTLKGAIEFTKHRRTGCKFWVPLLQGYVQRSMQPHIWVHEPRGKKKSTGGSTTSMAIWVTPKGDIWCGDCELTYDQIMAMWEKEGLPNTFEVRFKDLTEDAQQEYLRFKRAWQPEELNLAIEPIAILER